METKKTNVSQQQLGAELYGKGSIFKTLIKITFPVYILMLVNSLYQIVDNLLAANLVDYGVEGWSGAQTAMSILPLFAIVMAVTILTSFGFGTIYAQKLGAGDKEGAIEAQSTAFWGTLMVNVILMLLILVVTPTYVNAFINENSGIPASLIDGIKKDAIYSAYIYTVVIIISSFQGILSRTLRTEGHIKSMSYIPLISIPVNITFDIIFMGVFDMGVVGAALASLIALSITLVITIAYVLYAKSKEKTNFRISNLKKGINFKILGLIAIIGLTPFLMQFLRAYAFTLNLSLMKNLTSGIVMSNGVSAYNEWMVFFSAATRPMTLIIMPAVAVMQSGAAFLGFNYGARNYKRVNKAMELMVVIMILLALPQYILVLSITKWLLIGFGVSSELLNTVDGSHMILMHRCWTAISLLSMTQGLTMIYLMSTKRNKYAIPLIIWNQLIVFTIVYVSFYFGFKGDTENYWHFFFANPVSSIFLAISSISVLLAIIIPDNIRLKNAENALKTPEKGEI